ncbi:MAG: DUF3536 domain-containing protein [Candidatus Saganbacteria bacterium]|nr:DUF3536 domain-containing protein [Candidatus Saganbacteria bacterium]
MDHYSCIHGHFYQPPRENPWLEEIELQDSAYPYHDWDKRITEECYAPNVASRILGPDRKIINIVNNCSKISFNFAPTLLFWFERHEEELYRKILEADRESQKNFSGHGSAIAQCYNHMIMPLANSRDKRTQIIWGIKDFEHRFQRKPEGMWLPETAVDMETLDIMAEYGIKFVILAQHQAKRARKIGDSKWNEFSDKKIDSKTPYLCLLPSGRTISIFFYDGPVSHDVAFGELLENGVNFAKRLAGVFSPASLPQIVHIATDGETYGHHHRFGDMALSYCLYFIESNNLAKITVYGEYLEKFPPTHEVEILEDSSWSCSHGVGRWSQNCGCNMGCNAGWTQEWRKPLREAMDWLRDNLTRIYDEGMYQYFRDPWKARDEYIRVILDRSSENVERFISENATRELAKEEKVRVLKFLEMQRHAMLMYTSCGWFFDDISGIESIQILTYAARAMQLARETSNVSFEENYLRILEGAPSNVVSCQNGAKVYELFVRPNILDLGRVAAHYGVSSLFEEYGKTVKVYSYTITREKHDVLGVGRQKLAIGNVHIRSDITFEEKSISFAILHLGDHNIVGGVCEFKGDDAFSQMHREIKEVFVKSDISRTIRLIEKHFADHGYSLWHLFKDEQRKILDSILEATLKEVEASMREINEQHFPIIQAMSEMQIPLPKALAITMELVLNNDLTKLLKSDEIDFNKLQKVIEEAKARAIEVDKVTVGFEASIKVDSIMERFSRTPRDFNLLAQVESLLKVLEPLSLQLDLWKGQNIYFFVGKELFPRMREDASKGNEDAGKWLEHFGNLGEFLRVRID